MTHPGRPVGPVPVKRAFVSAHLDMANDLRHAMLVERRPIGATKDPGWEVPVFLGNPPATFVGMSPIRPAAEKVIEDVVNLVKGCAAHDRSVVVAPTLDQGVQSADKGGLGYPSPLSYYLGQSPLMKDHLFF